MFDDPAFIDKMAVLERRHGEVSHLLGQPEIIAKRSEFMKLSKEHSDLDDLVHGWRGYTKLLKEINEAKAMIESESDPDMRELAKEEIKELEDNRGTLEDKIKILLLPKDPNDAKNILLEIRAGTGGDEAALFAGDLYRLYMRHAERNSWKTEIMSMSDGTSGGIKEVVVLISGKDV